MRTILLDVDGVLAPFSAPQSKDMGWSKKWELVHDGFSIYLNKSMGEAINELADRADASLVWCTSWLDDPESLELFAEYLDLDVFNPGKTPKITVANRYAEKGPSLWFDDDRWPMFTGHLIRPQMNVGLRWRHIADAQLWFEQNSK
jgi:hypothetical protein